jgi:hypothetical protein
MGKVRYPKLGNIELDNERTSLSFGLHTRHIMNFGECNPLNQDFSTTRGAPSELNCLLGLELAPSTLRRAEPELIAVQFEFNVWPIEDSLFAFLYRKDAKGHVWCVCAREGGVQRNRESEDRILLRKN